MVDVIDYNSFIATIELAFAIMFTIITVIFFIATLIFIWWVETKNRTVEELGEAIKNGFVDFFAKIRDVLTKKSSVKTVYADKSLNYSGTDFLPVPTKAPTDKYTYEFVGWDKNGVDANGNTVVRAIYLQKVTKCYINVFDDDKSTLIKTFEVEYGAGINLDDVKLEKPDTREFSYEFIGWDKDINAFYKNESVYAVYKAIPKKYTYTFFDEDGKTIINQGTAIYGTPIIDPVAPSKESTKEIVYDFAGWSGYENGMVLTRDISFVATYSECPVTAEKNSAIIKPDGDDFTIESETDDKDNVLKLNTLENKEHYEKITSVNPKTKDILGSRKTYSGSSVVVDMNNNTTNAEKIKEISSRDDINNGDDEIHQKIQLITTKKVKSDDAEKSKVIKAVPKTNDGNVVDEKELLKNMMFINKGKNDKKDN